MRVLINKMFNSTKLNTSLPPMMAVTIKIRISVIPVNSFT